MWMLSTSSQEQVYHQSNASQGRDDGPPDKQQGITQKTRDEGCRHPRGHIAIAFVAADAGVQRTHGSNLQKKGNEGKPFPQSGKQEAASPEQYADAGDIGKKQNAASHTI